MQDFLLLYIFLLNEPLEPVLLSSDRSSQSCLLYLPALAYQEVAHH